jgi:hypothetical protein
MDGRDERSAAKKRNEKVMPKRDAFNKLARHIVLIRGRNAAGLKGRFPAG